MLCQAFRGHGLWCWWSHCRISCHKERSCASSVAPSAKPSWQRSYSKAPQTSRHTPIWPMCIQSSNTLDRWKPPLPEHPRNFVFECWQNTIKNTMSNFPEPKLRGCVLQHALDLSPWCSAGPREGPHVGGMRSVCSAPQCIPGEVRPSQLWDATTGPAKITQKVTAVVAYESMCLPPHLQVRLDIVRGGNRSQMRTNKSTKSVGVHVLVCL